MGRLTAKRTVSLLVAVPGLLLLLATTRTWLVGRSADPLVGGELAATGAQLAAPVVALVAVCLVALVTALTGGAVVRRVSAFVLLVASAGAVVVSARTLAEPETALGRVAATAVGRTGVVTASAAATAWATAAVVLGVLLVLAAGLTVVATGRWRGLSQRFETRAGEAHTGSADGGSPGTGSGDPGGASTGGGGCRLDDAYRLGAYRIGGRRRTWAPAFGVGRPVLGGGPDAAGAGAAPGDDGHTTPPSDPAGEAAQ